MGFKYSINKSEDCISYIKIYSEELDTEQCSIIETWLNSDLRIPVEIIYEIIKQVYIVVTEGGTSDFSANIFSLTFEKEYTLFEYQYEHCFEEGKCPFKPCKVPTKLLYEILKVWAVEYEKWVKEREEFMRNNPNYKPKILGSAKDLLGIKEEE